MQVILRLILCLFSVSAALSAFAQSEGASNSASVSEAIKSQPTPEKQPGPIPDQSYDSNKEMKLIEVTGSYIKRVDEEGPSPVQTIGKDQLKKSGYNSVADVMRDNAITTGGQREDSGSATPGAATAGIGAFGADSILVLLNGQRLPKMGGENTVDLNLIPMDAIERVEILKDGASALYGSDAIGGVMNFITKKNMNGGTLSMRQSVSELGGGNRTDVSATFGKTFSRGSVIGVVQFRNNENLPDQRRQFSKITDVTTQGSFTGSPGSWYDTGNGSLNADPNCPPGQLFDGGAGFQACTFDYSQYSWNLPVINQTSSLIAGDYKFNEHLKSKTTAVVNLREVNTRYAPPPDTIRVSQAVAQSLGLPATGDVEINYRLVNEAGAREGRDTTFAYNVAQTLEGKIAGTWSYDVTAAAGRSRSHTVKNGYADKRVITDAINNGAFNPFAPEGAKGDITSALFSPFQYITSTQTSVKTVSSGQLYGGGSYMGPVAMAIGASTDWQTYSNEVDAITASGNSYGDIGTNGAGRRNYQAVFQEISMFPTETVEVGAAARFDQYSDFGSTFNPKLSVSWQASNKVMLRSSVGTGFRAPNLADVYNGTARGFPTFVDIIGCDQGVPGACEARQYEVNTTSNTNLTQETSLFANVGILVQPKKNWNIEANYWTASVTDGVGAIDDLDLVRFEQANGAQALQDAYGISIERDPNTGQLLRIQRPSAFNITNSNFHGLDFRVSNESKANIGNFPIDVAVTVNHTQFIGNEREDFPGLGIKRARDLYFKNQIAVTASHTHHSLTAQARTLSGANKNANESVVGGGSLPIYTEYDLNYEHSKILGGTLSAGVKNLFNSDRPLDDTISNPVARLDMSKYDPLGRMYYMGYRYNF
ncbi:MAG: TonB-dependent receptor [Bdellovibrionales bacterium]|nr:TonB-dependent receptor [Bdellovibrionales bacterium]